MSILEQCKTTSTGHSSTVTMSLHIGAESLCVVQSSKNAIKLKTPDVIPPGDAILETIVDGRSHRRPIRVLAPADLPNWVAIADR